MNQPQTISESPGAKVLPVRRDAVARFRAGCAVVMTELHWADRSILVAAESREALMEELSRLVPGARFDPEAFAEAVFFPSASERLKLSENGRGPG